MEAAPAAVEAAQAEVANIQRQESELLLQQGVALESAREAEVARLRRAAMDPGTATGTRTIVGGVGETLEISPKNVVTRTAEEEEAWLAEQRTPPPASVPTQEEQAALDAAEALRLRPAGGGPPSRRLPGKA